MNLKFINWVALGYRETRMALSSTASSSLFLFVLVGFFPPSLNFKYQIQYERLSLRRFVQFLTSINNELVLTKLYSLNNKYITSHLE